MAARLKLRSPKRLPSAPSGSLKLPSAPRVAAARRGSRAYEQAHEEAAQQVQDIGWEEFLRFFASKDGWRQGEHVTFVAATGQGKTTLALELLPIRKYTVAFATKKTDTSLYPKLKAQGFVEQKVFEPNPETVPKVLLHPPFEGKKSLPNQRRVFESALAQIFKAGGWCVYMDELRYLTDNLGLKSDVDLLYLQGRSLGVSMVGTSQRPAWIPETALSQATHLFIGPQSEQRDIDRAAEVSGRKGPIVRAMTSELEDFEFLYVNTRRSGVPVYRVRVEM